MFLLWEHSISHNAAVMKVMDMTERNTNTRTAAELLHQKTLVSLSRPAVLS